MRWLVLLLFLVGCGDDKPMPVTVTLRPVSLLVAPTFMPTHPPGGSIPSVLSDDNPTTWASYIHFPSDAYRLGFDASLLPVTGVITEISTVVHRTLAFPGLISAMAFVHTVHYGAGLTVPMGTDNMPNGTGVMQVRTLTVSGLNIPVGEFTSIGVNETSSWCCFGLSDDLLYIEEMYLLVTVSESPIVQKICIDGEFRLASLLGGEMAQLIVLGETEPPKQLLGETGAIDAPGEFRYQHPVAGEIPECG